MESSFEELVDLKYSIALEIPLEEIKPTYDAVYKQLKKTRLNGFRPGKHPKGYGETSGTKVRSGKLPKKTNKPSYHYGDKKN